MQMFLEGRWQSGESVVAVKNPFNSETLDEVPQGTAKDIDRALTTLVTGARLMRQLTGYERAQILRRVALLMAEREPELARTISQEEGKVLSEGVLEASRAREVMEVSAEEARRIIGEMIPLDAAPGVKDKLGFTLRVPCGIVAAICPFNFPLNLVCHKVGPAIAAGNAVLIKPASDTPLSALKLVEILLAAGLPPEAVACITGPGGELGDAICRDPRVRKISFTGSYEIGDQIVRAAGVKRVTLELGSNSPVIILDDADLEKAAAAVTATGYANAGQTCISAQRILTLKPITGDFLDALKPRVSALRTGDQLNAQTQVGPLVRERDARRVESWINEAVQQGAKLVTGGTREGSVYSPTILAQVKPEMRVSCEELFGPAVVVTECSSIDEAIHLANQTRFGLSAGIFTQNVDKALRFAREVDCGNLHINWTSQWRADLMPYGGLKDSGIGKEGPRYAVREMTEEKMVVWH